MRWAIGVMDNGRLWEIREPSSYSGPVRYVTRKHHCVKYKSQPPPTIGKMVRLTVSYRQGQGITLNSNNAGKYRILSSYRKMHDCYYDCSRCDAPTTLVFSLKRFRLSHILFIYSQYSTGESDVPHFKYVLHLRGD